ncbi:MAG: FAD-dependent oxidoreductase, partial [Bryobacteraceae bacterium]
MAAAREGLSTALLEPGDHVGGMVSGGLSWTDVGKREVIGGYALEFYWRAGRHYDMRKYIQDIAWTLEPGVAEKILRDMLRESRVTVFMRHRLREKGGVVKPGTRVTRIVMENGAAFEARIFVDSTYEGDLMAQAGLSYTWGR